MVELVTETLKSIPLDLKFRILPYYDDNGNINGGYFSIINKADNTIVTKFILEQFKGCNGVVISRKVSISNEYRGNGYGNIFCRLRENIAKSLNYSVIMCTVVYGNIPQEKIMAKNEWQKLIQFLNLKTNNNVSIYYKKLQ
jgi:hypothetical protein